MKNVDNIKITQQVCSKNTKNDVKKINFENKCDSFEKTSQCDTPPKPKFEIVKQIKKLTEVLSRLNSIKQKNSDNAEITESTGNNAVLKPASSTDLTSAKTDITQMTYEEKVKLLTEKGADLAIAKQISKLDEHKYVMFSHLIRNKDYDVSNAELISVLFNLTNNQCVRFNELYEKGLSYEEAFNGMNLKDSSQTEKYATLIKKGVKADTALNAIKLNDTQYERFLYFIDSGTSGSEALNLTDLDIEQYKRYKNLINEQFINFNDAHEAAKLDFETQYPKFMELTISGVFSSVAIEASKLNEDEYLKFKSLIKRKSDNPDKYKNVREGILLKIATMNQETEYPKFNELCNKGVDITTATNAVREFDDIKYSRFVTLIDKNINSFFAYNAADLENSQFKRFETFIEKGINADSALELAKLLKDDYSSLCLRKKIDVLEDLKQIQKYYINDKEDTKILNLQAEIEKVENSMKQVISAADVSKEQTIQMMKGFFANNNEETENTLATANFSLYGKKGIPLTYSRTEFLNDLSGELRKLPAETQADIIQKLGIDVIKDGNGNITGYNGIIDLTKLSSEGCEGDILLLATEFIKENKVKTGNENLDKALNSLLQGMPEFINIIGKQQHERHKLSVDTHILRVLQNVINNPEYKNLSDTDKFCLKFATVLHDIAKSEGIVDESHADFSALYSRDILRKYNLPAETKNRIFEFIKNHHWLAEYNQSSISADKIASMFRRSDDLTSARIFAEADLRGVSDEFYEAHKMVLDSSIQEPVSNALKNINSSGEIFLTNSVINKSKVPTVNHNGKSYKVINFSKLSKNTDLEQYGFEPNTTVDNFRVLVHTIKENSIKENCENVLMLGDSANEGFLCASFISVENKNTYHDNKYGLVVNSENVNIANASKVNQNSGFEKGFEDFSYIITGKARESMYRDKISKDIKSNLELTDSEYAQLYSTLQKYKHASGLDNVPSITVNGKTLSGTQIKNAVIFANNSIINSKYHNEVNVYTPQVNAIIAKVDEINEVPQPLLDFAQEHNFPIYLLGAEKNLDLKKYPA